MLLQRRLTRVRSLCMFLLLVGCGQVEDFVPDLPDLPDASLAQEQRGSDAALSERSEGGDPEGAPDASTPRDASSSELDARVQLDAGAGGDAGNGGRGDAGSTLDGGAADGGASSVDASAGDAASADAAANDAATRDAMVDAANDAAINPSAPTLPAKTGTCPQFVSGDVNFSPSGVATRKVRLWVGTNGGGPLVIYWHSTNNQPIEAENSALAGVISQITAAGGVVAAPYTGANDGAFPWLDTTTESLKVADEIVACAIEVKSINSRRIHALGFSAGGLMTSTMTFLRSNYLSSVVTYSGGLQGSAPAFQNAANKLAALIFHGGSGDTFLINFQTTSNSYRTALRNNGSYTATCNHGGGHAIPSAGAAAAWRFFQDHPFGTQPSPYVAGGLPTTLPNYCSSP